MATQSVSERRMTAEEYVAFELASDARHEFHDGRVYAMSGASKAHNTIAGNIYMRLRAAARGGRSRVFMEGVRLVLPSGPHYYPDVLVACEPSDDPLVETAPCLVVEVLSPSTRRLDIERKLPRYQAIPSVEAVLIVRQDARWVEVRRRSHKEGGAFVTDHVIGQGTVDFPCPGPPDGPVAMTLDEIYEGAEPPPNAELDASDPEPPAR